MASAAYDDLFTLDVVRDFMMSKGGKVNNTTLVTHFKSFLNDPVRKDKNRQLFKQYVNTLATVKLDVSGEKLLVLKKKYRLSGNFENAGDPGPGKPTSGKNKKSSKIQTATTQPQHTEEELVKPGIEPVNVCGGDADKPDRDFEKQELEEDEGADDTIVQKSDDEALVDVPPELSEKSKVQPELDVESKSQEEKDKYEENNRNKDISEVDGEDVIHKTANDFPEVKYESEPFASSSSFEIAAEVEQSGAQKPEPEIKKNLNSEPETPNTDMLLENKNNHTEIGERSVIKTDTGNSNTPSMTETLQTSSASPESVSVKERAQHLNKADIIKPKTATVMVKPKKEMKREHKKVDENGSPDYDFSLNNTEREWILKSSYSDYQVLAKILLNNPHLATKQDFITGYTALHWAAKNGNSDIIKLLCGTYSVSPDVRTFGGYTALHLAAMHGHETIVELLVKVYHANANLRDYSGKKAKQYLPMSASTTSHQLLQARHSVSSTSTDSSQLHRSGSYNSRVREAGHFGINAGAAVKDTWSTSLEQSSRSPSESPITTPQVRHKGSLQSDADLMPPPRKLPSVHRKAVNKDKECYSDSEMQSTNIEPELHVSDSSPNFGTLV